IASFVSHLELTVISSSCSGVPWLPRLLISPAPIYHVLSLSTLAPSGLISSEAHSPLTTLLWSVHLRILFNSFPTYHTPKQARFLESSTLGPRRNAQSTW